MKGKTTIRENNPIKIYTTSNKLHRKRNKADLCRSRSTRCQRLPYRHILLDELIEFSLQRLCSRLKPTPKLHITILQGGDSIYLIKKSKSKQKSGVSEALVLGETNFHILLHRYRTCSRGTPETVDDVDVDDVAISSRLIRWTVKLVCNHRGRMWVFTQKNLSFIVIQSWRWIFTQEKISALSFVKMLETKRNTLRWCVHALVQAVLEASFLFYNDSYRPVFNFYKKWMWSKVEVFKMFCIRHSSRYSIRRAWVSIF